jgi:hypothetical protein
MFGYRKIEDCDHGPMLNNMSRENGENKIWPLKGRPKKIQIWAGGQNGDRRKSRETVVTGPLSRCVSLLNKNPCQHTAQMTLITPWPESASKLYRQSDSRLSAKLMPTFANRGCHVVSATDPYSRILCF